MIYTSIQGPFPFSVAAAVSEGRTWFVRLNALQYANAQHQMRREALNVVDMHGRIKVLEALTP